MWAAQLTAPQRFEACEAPDPDSSRLEDGQVLLRTRAGGICGSDLVYFRGMLSPDAAVAPEFPERPGFPVHEVVGTVLASRHQAIAVGDDVVGWASKFDAIAEYVISDGDGLAVYEPSLRPEIAVMLQPLACVLYAVDQLGAVSGRRAAVIGQGPIGLLFSHVLKSAGATHVTGVDRVDRSDLAGTFGVDEAVWAPADRWARSLSDSDRPQVVVEAVGHQTATLNDAVTAVAPRGEIYYFGIPDELAYPFHLRQFLRKDLTLRSGVTRERRHWLDEANTYLDKYPELADAYVTDILPATEITTAFERAVTPKRGQAKIVFTMPGR